MFFIKKPYHNEKTISMITSKSMNSLDEDKKIVRHWKEEWEKNKEKRIKFLKENPGIFKNESGEKNEFEKN